MFSHSFRESACRCNVTHRRSEVNWRPVLPASLLQRVAREIIISSRTKKWLD